MVGDDGIQRATSYTRQNVNGCGKRGERSREDQISRSKMTHLDETQEQAGARREKGGRLDRQARARAYTLSPLSSFLLRCVDCPSADLIRVLVRAHARPPAEPPAGGPPARLPGEHRAGRVRTAREGA